MTHQGDTQQAKAEAHGSFGELLQGVLPEKERHFLITLPIERHATAKFIRDGGALRVQPKHKTKSLKMAARLLAHFGATEQGFLILDNGLAEGKGFASSSADLVATARAVAGALERELSRETLCRILGELEPTDGVMYPHYVVFHHREVRLGANLGKLPRMRILAIDEGGSVDTLSYNKRHTTAPLEQRHRYAHCLEKMYEAFKNQDLQAIGRIATLSARLNQTRNPKRHLEAVIDMCHRHGGLGVAATHSGPCLGILIAHHDPDLERKQRLISEELSSLGGELLCFDTLRESACAPKAKFEAPLPSMTTAPMGLNRRPQRQPRG